MALKVPSEAEVQLLARQCIEPDATEPMGVYVSGLGEPCAELTKQVERTVFYEAFGDTPELLAKEYDPYDETSIFVCVIDHARKVPVGEGRIVMPAPGGPGLKTANDIPNIWGESAREMVERSGLPMDLEEACDLATTGVMPEYRFGASAGLVSAALYHTGLQLLTRSGVDWMIAIQDSSVQQMIRDHFHGAFVPFEGTEPKAYMGSAASYPVWFCATRWVSRVQEEDPDMLDFLVKGDGLRQMVRMPDWDQAVGLLREVSRPRPSAAETTPAASATSTAQAGSVAGTPAPEAVRP